MATGGAGGAWCAVGALLPLCYAVVVTPAQIGTPLAATPSWWRIPKPDEPVRGWHVSPLVDVLAYHFSWLFILVPLALAGDVHPTDYLAIWAIGITTSFVHRHVTMPYVYLDGQVFRAFKPRLTLIPVVLFCGFVASMVLQTSKAPAGFFTPAHVAIVVAAVAPVVSVWWRDRRGDVVADRTLVVAAAPAVVSLVAGLVALPVHADVFVVVSAVAVAVGAAFVLGRAAAAVVIVVIGAGVASHFGGVALNDSVVRTNSLVGAVAMVAALWNIWHTAAQKVGILRVYNAKSAAPVDKKVPLWVDRALVFGWFPFLAALLVDRERATILQQGKVVKMYLGPIVDGVSAAAPILYPVGIALIVLTLGTFLRYEYRATGLKSAPRLSMALGLTMLSASFLFASPLKCYVAYGFSHAVEYVVFVWAFQRRRYAQPLDPQPLLQRLLKHGFVLYGAFIAVVAGLYLWSEFGTNLGFYDKPVRVFGMRTSMVIYVWAIWHSMAHFYFDGFLWKMRPTVRAAL